MSRICRVPHSTFDLMHHNSFKVKGRKHHQSVDNDTVVSHTLPHKPFFT